jgi:predicted dehydrogenase
MKKVKVGVIGLGMGRWHLRCFKDTPEAEIYAVADVKAEKLAEVKKEYEVPHAFEDYKKMLELKELDAVAIVTPNTLHKPMVLDAVKAGKHILCEKPMAMNAAEAQEMLDAANKANLKLMINFNQRFTPTAMYLKERIEAGELGEIYHGKTGWIRRGKYTGTLAWLAGEGGSWFCTKKLSGGGALIDIGVHVLDLAMWLMGDVQPVTVYGSTWTKFGPEVLGEKNAVMDVDDWASAYVKFDNGADLLVEASWAGHIAQESIYTSLMGTEGGADRISAEGPASLRIYKEIDRATVDYVPNCGSKKYETAPEHFVHSIVKDVKPIAPGEDGVRVMKVLDAIYESSRTGKAVDVK